MKGKNSLIIGFIGIILFIFIAAYLWYLYFLKFYDESGFNNSDTNQQGRLVLIDITSVNATNEESKESGSGTPSYFFRVDNNKKNKEKYILYIEDTPYNLVNDGCGVDTTLKRSDLSYQLKLDGLLVDEGSMLEIKDNILDVREIDSNSSLNYELTVWINENAVDWEGKHYHYKVTLNEVNQ